MSEYGPNFHSPYEPNEPASQGNAGNAAKPLTASRNSAGAREAQPGKASRSEAFHWSADAWEVPAVPERAYTQRTWDEEDYPPNEPEPAPSTWDDASYDAPPADSAAAHPDKRENPYARPTWDETAFLNEPELKLRGAEAVASVPDLYEEPEAPPHERNARLADRTAGDTSMPARNPYARPSTELSEGTQPPVRNHYERPPADAADGVSDLSARFAPPVRFELPSSRVSEPRESQAAYHRDEPNVYQTRRPSAYAADPYGINPSNPPSAYRVEEENASARRQKARKRIRRLVVVLLVLLVLGLAAYLKRAWILEQLKPLLGEATVASVNEAVNQAVGVTSSPVVGYDAAPAIPLSDSAKKGINAVAGGLGLQTYTVTASNVVARVATADGLYDYYLFAAKNGQLLGYYEGLGDYGLAACPDDLFYLPQAPYLIDAKGRALLDPSVYRQSAGEDAILGPMMNGWSLICDASRTRWNFINAQGKFLSTLWFAKTFPFTAEHTVAYVDTGNVSDPAQRYTLYEIDRNGGTTLWRHTADTAEVIGCASGVAVLQSGEIIRLDGAQTVLSTSDEVTAYVDCGAVVARDPGSGLYGLYVNGEQQYDFQYDSIAPVSSDIQWARETEALYTQCTVTGLSYPLPLSHYFSLRQGEGENLVALSTSSVYPLLLNATH